MSDMKSIYILNALWYNTMLVSGMSDSFVRTIALIGENAFEKLQNSHVCVFGCGGVGSYALEALARSGVGEITLVDADFVQQSNINRQLIALHSTINFPKVQAAKNRILDINPLCKVNAVEMFYDENSELTFNFDYIVDAIDSVPSKLHLIEQAVIRKIPIISAMGAGNKLDPALLRVSDISKTEYCPLAKKIRVSLRKRGINHLKVVYSPEEPVTNLHPPGSIAFVPSVAGLLMASEVIKDIGAGV